MQIETSQGNVEFELLDNTKLLGIRVSGGLDSAMNLFITCTYLTETNSNIPLFPMTTNDWKKPYQVNFATNVIAWCKEQFPNVNFLEHSTHQLEHGEDYIEGQQKHKINALRSKCAELEVQRENLMVVHGQNLAPPKEVTDQWLTQDGQIVGGPDPRDGRNQLQETWKPEIRQYRPLINLDKKGIHELYQHFGLLDTLFNETRSCENSDPEITNNFTTHCGECWWCRERQWGFGKL